jgi:hypothetical protein
MTLMIIAEGASLPARHILLSGLRVCSTPLKHFSEDESGAKVRGGGWGRTSAIGVLWRLTD